MRDLIANIIRGQGVADFGVCDYTGILPLIPCRGSSRIPEDAASVLVCVFPYYTGEYPRRNVARYAVGDDYHSIVGAVLCGIADALSAAFPGERFAPFVDSSPIREVPAAHLAGLGVVGQNGQLIHPRFGSYLFIGTVVTSLRLPAGQPAGGGCLNCGLCVRSCPTGALQAGKALDIVLCRSHITQKKGALSPWEQRQVATGGLVWGCDMCSDVCPMNKQIPPSPIRGFFENAAPWFDPEQLEALAKSKAYGYRGKQVLMRNYQLIYGESAGQE